MATMMEAICASCSSIFEREIRRGRPATKCPDCRGRQSTLLQFSKNNGATVEWKQELIDGVTWVTNTFPCVACSEVFMRPRKRGRPPTRCPDCQASVDAEKAVEVTISDEKLEELYTGPRHLLLGTKDERPKGAEAQCPTNPGGRGCGRIFTSDGACEQHKCYGADGNIAYCKDPATLGMEPRERRGLPVWTRPTPKDETSTI